MIKKSLYYVFLSVMNICLGGIVGYFLLSSHLLKFQFSTFYVVLLILLYALIFNVILIVLWYLAPGHFKEFGGLKNAYFNLLMTMGIYIFSSLFFLIYFVFVGL